MNKKIVSELSLLCVALVWGATFVIVQNAISILPPLEFNAIRFFIAGVIIFVVYCFNRKRTIPLTWSNFLPSVLLGFCLFIGYSLQTIGLVYTTPSKAGFITGLSVVMVPFLSIVYLRKLPSLTAIIGSIAAVFGLYLLAFNSSGSLSIGDFYVFLSAFGFAFHIILTDRIAKKIPVLFITTVQIFTVSFFCMVGSFLFEDWLSPLSNKSIYSISLLYAIIITAVLATAAAFFIQTVSQRNTTPTRVAIILTMEPVFAAITSYIWVQERLSIAGIVGCLFIFLGMIISELSNALMPFKSHYIKSGKKT